MKQKSSTNKVFHFLHLKTDRWVFALRSFLCHLYLLWGLNKRFSATCWSARLLNKHASKRLVLHTSGHSMAHCTAHVPCAPPQCLAACLLPPPHPTLHTHAQRLSTGAAGSHCMNSQGSDVPWSCQVIWSEK